MRIRMLALVGFLAVLGGMMNAERPTSQTATVMEDRVAGSTGDFDDPYPPPTPRP
jgi:hypothetical protein